MKLRASADGRTLPPPFGSGACLSKWLSGGVVQEEYPGEWPSARWLIAVTIPSRSFCGGNALMGSYFGMQARWQSGQQRESGPVKSCPDSCCSRLAPFSAEVKVVP